MEGVYRQAGHSIDYTPDTAVSAGEVIQLPDGRAAVASQDIAAGSLGAVQVSGIVRMAKTTGIVLLPGGKAYWDHSANKVHFKTANDRDFSVGVVMVQAASADTEVDVALNVHPCYLIDVARDPCTTAIVGTAAAEGFGRPKRIGGSTKFLITATNEAQKVDLLSNQGFAAAAKAIVEARLNVVSDGAGTVVDVSVGLANGTHADNADSITEACFVHLDANNANINAESDDGTTEVAATDTTVDYVEGTPFEVWFDCRDPEDIQIYVDGVLVLPNSVFKLDQATGPLKLLVHVEKSASTDTYELDVEWLRARIMQQ